MAQKTNPTLLRLNRSSRLKTLRNRVFLENNACTSFASCWYSDVFYTDFLDYDIKLRSYLQHFSKQTKHAIADISLLADYNKFLALFLLKDTRGKFVESSYRLGLRKAIPKRFRKAIIPNLSDTVMNLSLPHTNSDLANISKKTREESFHIALASLVSHRFGVAFELQNGIKKRSEQTRQLSRSIALQALRCKPEVCTEGLHVQTFGLRNKRSFLQAELATANATATKTYNTAYNSIQVLESSASRCLQLPLTALSSEIAASNPRLHEMLAYKTNYENLFSFQFIRVLSDTQTSRILVERIRYLLENRANFRRIKHLVFQQAIRTKQIKGLRFSLMGRFGGRAKGGQKAKRQSYQFGSTALNSFSNPISFSSSSALTPSGKVGVKLWLSFHSV